MELDATASAKLNINEVIEDLEKRKDEQNGRKDEKTDEIGCTFFRKIQKFRHLYAKLGKSALQVRNTISFQYKILMMIVLLMTTSCLTV